jgi:cellulose synthase/poly-beta-1,6-N-acetylglucosamine synthase-like glycosyltransferase
MLARLRPFRPIPHPEWTPMVTACIPVHNARSHVEAKLESLLEQSYPADRLEILVYCDGCTDGSEEVVLRMAERDPRVRPIISRERSGKPTAVNRMREEARGEVLLMTDIRQPLVPGALRALVTMLGDPRVGCVSGNLVLRGATGAGAYWRYESWIRNSEARFRSMVGVTGPIYVIRKDDLDPLPDDVILDDMWTPMNLRLSRRHALFCAEAIAYDDAFADEREFGRKVRTLAGNYQLFARLPRLLSPFANPSWLETTSHKLLRLLCPWALAVLAVTSVGELLVSLHRDEPIVWIVRALVLGQVVFYSAAILGSRAGKLGSLARTFVVMNWAAVVGLWRFATGRQAVTW